jgi:hypothetical protein
MPWVPLHVVSDQRTRKPRTGVGVSARGRDLHYAQILRVYSFPSNLQKATKTPVATLLHYYTPKGGDVVVVAEHLAPTATTTNS